MSTPYPTYEDVMAECRIMADDFRPNKRIEVVRAEPGLAQLREILLRVVQRIGPRRLGVPMQDRFIGLALLGPSIGRRNLAVAVATLQKTVVITVG